MGKIYRQGDVMLVEVDTIPDGLAKRDEGAVILAFGEHTGHHHRFQEGSGVCGFYKEGAEDHTIGGGTAVVGQPTNVVYLSVPTEGADLVHEEHDSISVEGGDYEVRRQREFVEEGLERQVVD